MRLAIVLSSCLAAGSALADGAPISGVLVLAAPEVTPGDNQLRCGLTPTLQDKTDTARDYALNFRRFIADGTISFVPIDHVACVYDAARGTEDCQISEQIYPDTRTAFYTAVASITPGGYSYAYFDSRADRDAALPQHGEGLPLLHNRLCDGLTPDTFAPYLAPSGAGARMDDLVKGDGDPFQTGDGPLYRMIARAVLYQLTHP